MIRYSLIAAICLMLTGCSQQVCPVNGTKTLSVSQMQENIRYQIKYETALRQTQAVLSGYNCPKEIPSLVAEIGLQTRIPVRILAAQIAVESSCNPHAVSKAGAVGLMQVNKRVWRTNKNLFNPQVNVQLGARILASEMHKHGIKNGLQRYFGVTGGSSISDEYATKVLNVAYRKN